MSTSFHTSWCAVSLLLWSCTSAQGQTRTTVANASLESELTQATYCAPHGPEVCLDGVDNNCNGLFEEGCGVAQGTVQFFVAWKRPEVDVDLVVVDPSGGTAELGAISRGGLLKERECPAKSEKVCKGGAYENVVLVASREPLPGRYRVEVTVDPAPAEQVSVVLAGRLGQQLVWEQFALDSTSSERKFGWDLNGGP